jgi:hypothetical protein
MKTRSSFVSNSSSSSFIIQVNTNKTKCPTCGHKIDTLKLIQELSGTNDRYSIDYSNRTEVVGYLKNTLKDDAWVDSAIYAKALEEVDRLNASIEVAKVTVPNGSEMYEVLVYSDNTVFNLGE